MASNDRYPNVIVVLTTQWRGQSVGYAGDVNACTPFLDSLAENSIDFTQAVTPHPFGVFARAALLTRTRCPENGISDYYDSLPPNARTMAHSYQERGYDTAFFGKWQLYERDPTSPVVGEAHARIVVPEERRGGFSFWEGFESGFLLNDGYYHGTRLPSPIKIPGYQSDTLVDRFSSFLNDRTSQAPLFSIVSLDAPHPPYGDNASGIEPQSVESISLPKEVPEDETICQAARDELFGYYAHIEATDRAIGRLVDRVKARLDWENTIFVFTSAHGDMHGSHGLFRKGWPHEESVRVPLILSWPLEFRKARRDPLLISLLDLGPTLEAFCFGEAVGDQGPKSGLDLSAAIRLKAEGPEYQLISMPSSPPFDKQCPYAWEGRRDWDRTQVVGEDGQRFTLDH